MFKTASLSLMILAAISLGCATAGGDGQVPEFSAQDLVCAASWAEEVVCECEGTLQVATVCPLANAFILKEQQENAAEEAEEEMEESEEADVVEPEETEEGAN